MKKTTKLRELFERKEIFVLPGGSTALQARLIEIAGFECAYMSGGNTCSTILGMADAGLATMTEMITNAGYMANAIDIPLVSDSDTGYGNAINVRRTVQAFIRAGVSGIHIEDQINPKRCGFVSGKEIISLEEAAGKYRAAVDARNELDPDFIIMARTDSRGAVGGGFEEALKRVKAYKEAGADVIYVEGPQSLEEVQAFRAAVDGPLLCTFSAVNAGISFKEQEELGMACAFYPGAATAPANIAAWEFLHDFKDRGVKALDEFRQKTDGHPLSNFGVYDYVGFPEIRKMEEKYLPEEAMEKYELSVGEYTPK